MATDPAITEPLETALLAAPDNGPLRLHLAALYLAGGEAERALEHCRTRWRQAPNDPAPFELGAQAAEAAGQLELAASLRDAAAMPPGPITLPGIPAVVIAEDVDDALLAELDPDPPITMADVAGMTDVKRALERSLLGPMRNPALRDAFRKSLRGGLLLWGPPGCGKTFLARAVAGEMGLSFLHVKLSDVLDMYLGNSEQKLAAIFTQARRQAPAVLFLDELDAIGAKRSRLTNSGLRSVVSQLLEELDGVGSDNDGVFILGATNAPWDVDSALRRPGRFDRTLLVLPPDTAARRAILDQHLDGRPQTDCDTAAIAARTETYSGADLGFVVTSAAEMALEESVDAGEVRPITADHLAAALAETNATTRTWLRSAADVAVFADDDALFGPLLDYARRVGIR